MIVLSHGCFVLFLTKIPILYPQSFYLAYRYRDGKRIRLKKKNKRDFYRYISISWITNIDSCDTIIYIYKK